MSRRPEPAEVDFDEWLLNVHDVFMNAQLMRTLMEREPVVRDAEEFMTVGAPMRNGAASRLSTVR